MGRNGLSFSCAVLQNQVKSVFVMFDYLKKMFVMNQLVFKIWTNVFLY